MDLRPAIVFIDEADDVLAQRRFAPAPDLVNRLLTVMDGASSMASDVVFIAATNHLDQVDPALLRAGRSIEKIEFVAPREAQLVRFICEWLEAKHVLLESGLDAAGIGALVGPRTIADTQGVLQQALNCTIERVAGRRSAVVTRGDVCAAVAVVCGADARVEAANGRIRNCV